MQIRLDDLQGPDIAALLQQHLDEMHATSPRESVHALDLSALRQPEVRFFTAWDGAVLAGCGALKALDATHAEIKSMRTACSHRRQGVARRMLQHLLEQAAAASYTRVSLETGSMAFFEPARALYRQFGFVECGPFAGYEPDRNSIFMTRLL